MKRAPILIPSISPLRYKKAQFKKASTVDKSDIATLAFEKQKAKSTEGLLLDRYTLVNLGSKDKVD